MRTSQIAEVLSRPLDQTVITVRAMGLSPLDFRWIERPDEQALRAADSDLRILGALTPDGSRVTELGKLIAELQIDPALAKIFFCGCREGAGEAAATLVGLISTGSTIFFQPGKKDPAKQAVAEQRHRAFYDSSKGKFQLPAVIKLCGGKKVF